MIVNFFRSSLLGSWSYCELKTLLVYNLGMTEPNGKKATLGTATHALLESLAIGKKYIQDNPTSEVVVIDHEHLGKFSFLVSDFYKIEELDNDTVDKINKSRKSKTIYKSHVPLKYGHKRMGQDCVNLLINKACQVYSLTSEDSWTPADFRDVNNWSWMTLDYLDGCFDPRNQDIISPEMSFDIELKRDWAKYSYEVKGEKFSGYLRLKGTIDLITRSNSGQIHIVDYKSGQRIDWGDNCKEKDFDYLLNDKQLMFYYYVASQLFPDDDIYITIFFIRDGGPFTIPFDRTRIPEIEQWLMEQFQEISSDELPKMVSESQTDFRCTRLCKFFKDGSCLKIANELKEKGLQYVIDNRQVPGFKIGTYVDPGATD